MRELTHNEKQATARYQQQLDNTRQALEMVHNLYREVVRERTDFNAVLAGHVRIWESRCYKVLPEIRKHEVRSVLMFLFHGPADLSIYQHLQYCIKGHDGIYYPSFDYWRAKYPDVDATKLQGGGHFWKTGKDGIGYGPMYSTAEERIVKSANVWKDEVKA